MLSTFFFTSLFALSNPMGDEAQVLLLDLKHSVEENEASIINGKIATSAVALGIPMITFNDMKDLVDLQGTRQLIDQDCDTQSCMNEIASALGTRFVVGGRLGRLEDTFVLQLTLNDTEEARTINRVEVKATSLSRLNDAIPDMVDQLFQGETNKPFPLIKGVGGALIVVGVVGTVGFGLLAYLEDQKLELPNDLSQAQKESTRSRGLAYLAGAGVSGIVLLAGAGTFAAASLSE